MIPKEISITGAVFRVELSPDLQESVHDDDGDFGQSHSVTQVIKISDKIEDEGTQERVLWHEFCHMVLARAGADHMLGKKMEETAVLALEHAWDDVVALVKATERTSKRSNRKRGAPAGLAPKSGSNIVSVSQTKAKRKRKSRR